MGPRVLPELRDRRDRQALLDLPVRQDLLDPQVLLVRRVTLALRVLKDRESDDAII